MAGWGAGAKKEKPPLCIVTWGLVGCPRQGVFVESFLRTISRGAVGAELGSERVKNYRDLCTVYATTQLVRPGMICAM
jgi:hypothetical protein